MKRVKVGDTFVFENQEFEVKRADDTCKGCFFENGVYCNFTECIDCWDADGDIIFVKTK